MLKWQLYPSYTIGIGAQLWDGNGKLTASKKMRYAFNSTNAHRGDTVVRGY
jgi:hypothetical protein